MGALDDYRAKYPQYKDISDQDLSDAIYRKYYAGKLSRDEFDTKLGRAPTPASQPEAPQEGFMQRAVKLLGSDPSQIAEGSGIPETNQKQAGQLLLSGVPVGGAYTPMSDDTKQFAKEHPYVAGLMKGIGGAVATAPLTFVAPWMMGMEGSAFARGGMGYLSNATIAGTDEFARKKQEGESTASALGSALWAAHLGGMFGGTLSGLNKGVVNPNLVGNAAGAAHTLGIDVNAPQALGGFAREAYDAASSWPLVGAGARSFQRHQYVQANRGFINEGLGSITEMTPQGPQRVMLPPDVDPGFSGRRWMGNRVQQEYRDSWNSLPVTGLRLDNPGNGMLNNIYNTYFNARNSGMMHPDTANRILQLADSQIYQRASWSGGRPGVGQPLFLTGQAADAADAGLRQIAADLTKSTNGDDRALATAVNSMRDNLHGELGQQFPQIAQRIENADTAWRHYSVMRTAGASTAVKGEEGYVTPKQVQGASAQLDPTFKRRDTSQGEGTYQNSAIAAQQILPNQMPDSGTAGRLAMGGLGAMALATPLTAAPYIAGLGALGMISGNPFLNRMSGRAVMANQPGREVLQQRIAPTIAPLTQGVMQGLNPMMTY